MAHRIVFRKPPGLMLLGFFFNNTSSTLNDLIKKSNKRSSEIPAVYCLRTTRSNLDEDGKIRKWSFGQRHAKMQNKTILMVGETGTGKTTLINTMVNYYLGVKFEDKAWFEITEEEKTDQTESKTSEITVYEITSEQKPESLTIIDTPGYGDTRGMDKDMEIPQNLYKLFLHDTGVKTLDAVCLVLKASQNRITERQRYIFEAVLSLFGKDIEDIVVLFITYSDGRPPSNVLESIKKEKVRCCHNPEKGPVYFLFDNCQSEKHEASYQLSTRLSWDRGERSLEEFFEFLKSRPSKNVDLTVSVLQKRMQLKASVQSLKERIEFTEAKQKELTDVQNMLDQNKGQIEKDENFKFPVTRFYKEKVNFRDASWFNRKATSCDECKENCHEYDCWLAPNAGWCSIMKGDYCTVCKCHYSKHVREARKYVTKQKEEIVTFKDLKKIYSNKKGGNIMYDENAFKNVETQLEKTLEMKDEKTGLASDLTMLLIENEKERKKSVKEACEAITNLSKIALKPDSALTIQYLEFLIPRVQEAGEEEWAQKLKDLQKAAASKSTNSTVEYMRMKLNEK